MIPAKMIVFLACVGLASAQASPIYPSDAVSFLSSCVPRDNDPCGAAIQVWDTPDGIHRIIVAERITRTPQRDPKYVATDSIPYPAVGGSFDIVVGCRVNGLPDPATVAIVRFQENNPVAKHIRHAWRLDANTGRFHALKTSIVGCDNPAP